MFEATAPHGRRYAGRAAAALSMWALPALPVALGWQRCALASLVHRPCPGCGMTRALALLAAGHLDASLRMHPLAVPALASGLLVAASTTWTTFVTGSPVGFQRAALGRLALSASALVYAAALALWLARSLGYCGGPVAV